MQGHILAIDQGTTGTTCLLVHFGAAGAPEIMGRGYAELPQYFPEPGQVEHDLHDIWASVQQAATQALAASGVAPAHLAGIGITNQRETVGLWRPDGAPVHRALVWQDRRTAPACAALRNAGHEAWVRARTGLLLDPYFSATKLTWLLNHVPGARAEAAAGRLRGGTIDAYLVGRLTGGAHVTDATNAARTQLLNLDSLAWDPELCTLFGNIPMPLLPSVRSCSEIYGHTQGLAWLPDGVPVAGMAGDQHAALLAQGCVQPGMAKCTYGTGAFALVNIGRRRLVSHSRLLCTLAWQLGGQATYALEGSVFVAGAAVQWLRDGLGLIGSSAEVEALAAQVPDTAGVEFVPALTGLGAPHWCPDARGQLTGLTRGTGRAHVARATLEGVALQVHDLLAAMHRDMAQPLSALRVDGGAAANALLMQFQADILDIEIHRPQQVESTALGAAYLAAMGVGLRTGVEQIAADYALERRFVPGQTPQWRTQRLTAWQRALALTVANA